MPQPSWPERDARLVDGSFFPVAARGTRFVAARFAAVVERVSDRPAVGDLERHVTYGELSRAVDAEVELLNTGLPAGPVVISVDDPVDLAISLISALSAGRACCLIDPNIGQSALEDLLHQIGGSIVFRGSASSDRPPLFEVLGSQAVTMTTVGLGDSNRRPSDVVTYLNTSGSTGSPKLITEHGVLPTGVELRDLDDSRPSEHLACNLSMTGVTFTRCLRALLSGDRFTAFALNRFSPRVLIESLASITPSHLGCTPTVLRHLTAISKSSGTVLESVETVRVSGEPVRWSDVAAARQLCGPGVMLENTYGATECGRVSMRTVLPDENIGDGSISAGRPIDGRVVWVAQEDRSPAPTGVSGTLVIEGPFSTTGMPLEDIGSGRYRYYSNDIGYLDEMGHLWLEGRADRTVKIAGMRLDLSVAEEALLKIPGVMDAVVVSVAIGDGVRLVAHVVIEAECSLDAAALRRTLAGDLAAIHLPARFDIRTEPFPLLASGKKDLLALGRDLTAPFSASE